jgi:hypothetical protein
MFNSDHEIADYAIEIEDMIEIDMNLSDMFSNDLSNYFNFVYNSRAVGVVECSLVFNFEVEEGSCELKILNPKSEIEEFYYNEVLVRHIDNKFLIHNGSQLNA